MMFFKYQWFISAEIINAKCAKKHCVLKKTEGYQSIMYSVKNHFPCNKSVSINHGKYTKAS